MTKYANNRNVSINLRDRFPYPYTIKDAENWIAYAGKSSQNTEFAIEINSSAVGGIGFLVGNDIFRRSAEVGYWLGEPFWGQGIMTEALKIVTEYGFEKLKFVRIHAGVFSSNQSSARVLEKAGYTLESRMRKAIVKEGQIIDQLMYVMVR